MLEPRTCGGCCTWPVSKRRIAACTVLARLALLHSCTLGGLLQSDRDEVLATCESTVMTPLGGTNSWRPGIPAKRGSTEHWALARPRKAQVRCRERHMRRIPRPPWELHGHLEYENPYTPWNHPSPSQTCAQPSRGPTSPSLTLLRQGQTHLLLAQGRKVGGRAADLERGSRSEIRFSQARFRIPGS